ncbi:hypothetical protein ACQP3C_27635, partial [Escherichia coli]
LAQFYFHNECFKHWHLKKCYCDHFRAVVLSPGKLDCSFDGFEMPPVGFEFVSELVQAWKRSSFFGRA